MWTGPRRTCVVGYARRESTHTEAARHVQQSLDELVERAGFDPALRAGWVERFTATREFERWLDEQVSGWSLELDGIVWLVAPEEVLLERINERKQEHEAKGRSLREGLDVLSAHQGAYEVLFERLAALGKPPVFTFDTSLMSPTRIAEEIERVLARDPSRRPVNAGPLR